MAKPSAAAKKLKEMTQVFNQGDSLAGKVVTKVISINHGQLAVMFTDNTYLCVSAYESRNKLYVTTGAVAELAGMFA